ncbi:MAG TPA: exodeoxyribonuclease V subunit gamma [bacterium]|nr:exodeoxyribonuclease V subunit gamma [bacterium]HPQ65842.1 exodeoxyribonuclease V subunit gamma [bacterium]
MRNLQVFWGDRMEALAEHLFAATEAAPPEDPFQRECVVVESRVVGAWLKHYFLYDRRRRNLRRVLANWEFYPLELFFNDWLCYMRRGGVDPRKERFHPWGKEALQWRIRGVLSRRDFLENEECLPVAEYLGSPPEEMRVFRLAGTLAELVDDYQLYRPEMLLGWEDEDEAGKNAPEERWQRRLWRELQRQEAGGYPRELLSPGEKLKTAGLAERYPRLRVLTPGSLSPVYLDFFFSVSTLIPVSLYLFNPCREEWFSDVSRRGKEKRRERRAASGGPLGDEYLETGNPLLSSLGKVSRDFLGDVLDRTGGQVEELSAETSSPGVLGAIQEDIARRRWIPGSGDAESRARLPVERGDGSLAIHICHSPRREVETVKDVILDAFARDRTLQPRQVQVLVGDIEVYMPLVESIFPGFSEADDENIPFVVAERTRAGAGVLSSLLMRLLEIPKGRFELSSVVELLEYRPLREAFGIGRAEADLLREWAPECGVRWGFDEGQREKEVGIAYRENSWREGVDRMLLGYAMRRGELELDGGERVLAPFPAVEGEDAEAVGKLESLLEALLDLCRVLSGRETLRGWSERLREIWDRFCAAGSEEDYREAAAIEGALNAVASMGELPGVSGEIPIEPVAEFLVRRLERRENPPDALTRNAVVVSALRAGRPVPRRLVCLLGMNDGEFPRSHRRAGFDLLKTNPARGDRSPPGQDRQAFLEALLCAREAFAVCYTGRSRNDNEAIPPSTVLSELRSYLKEGFELPPAHASADGQELLYCETLHRLQPFSPDYFREKSGLFSYSRENLAGARALAEAGKAEFSAVPRFFAGSPLPLADSVREWRLDDLERFWSNPARFLYREALKTEFSPPRRFFPDDELLEMDPLSRHAARREIADAWLEGARDRLTRSLRARGLVAPLRAGEEQARLLVKEVELFMRRDLSVFGLAGELEDHLRSGGEILPVEVDIEGIRIEGRRRLYRSGSGPGWSLEWRPGGKLRALDLIRGWVAHLAVCACRERTPMLLVSLEECALIEGLAAAEARARLQSLLEMMLQGLEKPLPFAPETAWAYIRKAHGPEGEALAAAEQAWEGHRGLPGDGDDAYQRRALGEAGPVSHPRFPEVARAVFAPLLEKLQGVRSWPTT